MSNAKHTAGPWSLHPYSNGAPFEVINESGQHWIAFDLAIGAGNKIVAIVQMLNGAPAGYPSVETEDECRANAALIAAAPDLLAALKDCVGLLEWVARASTSPIIENGPSVIAAKKVIAAATGANHE